MTDKTALLDVQDLRISFKTDEGIVKAVDGVNFTVERGQTLGIVGESGSGKSVTTKALMQLLPNNAIIDENSKILLERDNGQVVDVARMKPKGKEIRKIRGDDLAMIFQEPMSSFSPVYTIGNQIMEAIRANSDIDKREARKLGISMLERVGISSPAQRFDQYPFEMSGGMRQRAMIATALSTSPALLIADEPTTALDVTIQAQILALMKELKQDFDMSMIFISHDLGVISQIADTVAVMYLGRIVETGTIRDVIKNPKHPYTQNLLKAIPKIEDLDSRLQPVGGDIPGPMNRPSGCPFHPRCQQIIEGHCESHIPTMISVSESQSVNCFLYEEGLVSHDTTTIKS